MVNKETGNKLKREDLNKRKVDVFKIVFQSMANLTVLLENMVKHPYINSMFEEEVKALFFAKASPELPSLCKNIIRLALCGCPCHLSRILSVNFSGMLTLLLH